MNSPMTGFWWSELPVKMHFPGLKLRITQTCFLPINKKINQLTAQPVTSEATKLTSVIYSVSCLAFISVFENRKTTQHIFYYLVRYQNSKALNCNSFLVK